MKTVNVGKKVGVVVEERPGCRTIAFEPRPRRKKPRPEPKREVVETITPTTPAECATSRDLLRFAIANDTKLFHDLDFFEAWLARARQLA